MLTFQKHLNQRHFRMTVTYERDINIEFVDVFSFLRSKPEKRKVVFIDPIVLANHDQFLQIEASDPGILLVPTNVNESNKDLESLTSILSVLETNGIGRRGDVVFAVGGGALLDVVAFATSVFRRGIAIVKIPTTLLGIVDASIGIKTGINFLGQRNRLGSYNFDYDVAIDPVLMGGLHRTLVRQGLGEIFKIAVIKSCSLFDAVFSHGDRLEDPSFYCSLEGKDILVQSINLMLEELHENPRELNLKRCVDYGHSFSPLVEMESISRRGYKSLSHGYAVAYDCILSATIASNRGILGEPEYRKILSLFMAHDFDFANDIYRDYNLLWASFLEMVKHRGGSQNLPVPSSIGAYDFIQDLSFDEMKASAVMLAEAMAK